ncbi:HypC/HybG/HupF family hydrogenase formation chaperone [Nocardia sp. NBC_00565]|uniref:HypC/HybG/HupF family hydrogenase formation chaperone n=1 Tax=Nocardia sp. NBC_00565 TaxID=2975993 RepID=UPI002E815D35|nr:HypC/HybG/HupF family hydrogenase formation chaperone [Nocardia sp. NBC_00565]WUC06465.1 HypC/HybG/HupF family hydrogenase formation chaperone [Nocardia sp. NBC_00565]
MCLGIPGRVVEILDGYHNQIALVDVSGEKRKVNIGLLEDDPAQPGDWVIIHMGFAIEKTDEAGAGQALDGLRLLGSGGES